MATEATFKSKVIRALRGKCHAQAMSDRLRPGVPDHWYSGSYSDLWCEYKFDTHTVGAIRPDLSHQQLDWLNARYEEGRNVAVIVATSLKGGIIFIDKEWQGKKANAPLPFAELINFILARVNK